ncbi:MAG: hypothetical protein ABI821_18050 [Pseudomonadota bacterium]
MGKSKWVAVAIAASLGATAAHADGRGKMYITPFVGSNHIRIDSGRLYQQPETLGFDSLQVGATVGYHAPFGLVIEVGRSNAIHANIFDNDSDFEMTQGFGAVGWQVEFADGWHLTPRVGRARWSLSSNDRVLLDSAGERHHEIKGWDNFWEVALMRQVSDTFSLGVNFKDADEQFGHSRAGEFMVRFQF